MGGRGTVPPLPTPAGSLAQNHPDQQISELYAAIVNKAGSMDVFGRITGRVVEDRPREAGN